jgi:hypothetical protein
MSAKLLKRMGTFGDDIDSGHIIEHTHINRKTRSSKILTPESNNHSSSHVYGTAKLFTCQSFPIQTRSLSSNDPPPNEESKQPNIKLNPMNLVTETHRKVIYRVKGEKFVLYDYYQPIRILGHGAYAVVCEAIDRRTERRVA